MKKQAASYRPTFQPYSKCRRLKLSSGGLPTVKSCLHFKKCMIYNFIPTELLMIQEQLYLPDANTEEERRECIIIKHIGSAFTVTYEVYDDDDNLLRSESIFLRRPC